jgi:hypothetical protein
MNRERLKTLRDHLASLPDERVDMRTYVDWDAGPLGWGRQGTGDVLHKSGTAACIAGWAVALFEPGRSVFDISADDSAALLGLTESQSDLLFLPIGYWEDVHTRADAIAAIDSMLANPDDNALPVWPEKAA